MKKICCILLFSVAWLFGQNIKVQYQGQTWPLNDMVFQESQNTWFNAGELFSRLNINHQWNPYNQQIVVQGMGKTLVFVPNFRVYQCETDFGVLEQVPQLRRGNLWLTQKDLTAVLQKWAALNLTWSSAENVLLINPVQDLLNAKLESRNNGDLLELNFAQKVRYESFFHAPHFILRLNNIKVDSESLKSLKGKLARKITVLQEEKAVQVTVLLSSISEGGELLEKDDGKTLQILFRRPQKSEQQSYAPTPEINTKKIKTVVIDPGHGGKDPGAIGLKAKEKDIVLAVGLLLRDKLKKEGFKVKMTRDTDKFVELQERPAIASKAGGDLFISLHCNAIDGNVQRKRRVEGFKIYILREAESEEDRAIARRENQAAMLSSKKTKAEISPVEWILLENQLNLYTKESETFTSILVDTMSQGKIAKLGSGAGQAGFMVLVGAFMPSALVELGFITNPNDELYMMSKKGQADLAERISQAVVAYRNSVEKRYIK
ncbi:MAG: N-acetylmuramoyl-L-alanine amidase [Fibrobacter sp.]|nr:N-acetylmuramoyl-L-alanine amidase [Fibrobacter sp.]